MFFVRPRSAGGRLWCALLVVICVSPQFAFAQCYNSSNAGLSGSSFIECAGDPQELMFTEWMRLKGYPECIVQPYINWYRAPESREALFPFLADRPVEDRLSAQQVVHVYDIIPTDPEAAVQSLDDGDRYYRKIEQHFEETFGVDFQFVYHRLFVRYSEAFGAPQLVSNPYGKFYRFGSRRAFLEKQNFEPHSIVFYALKRFKRLPVGDMTGASFVAELNVSPRTPAGMQTFTHEFGHTFGLPHPFKSAPYAQFQMDGVMSNTYGPGSIIADPTDPLERYALEPFDGEYLDDGIFADNYASGIMGSQILSVCGRVELAITKLSARELPSEVQFFVRISNLGKLEAVNVPLTVMAGEKVVMERVIYSIPAGASVNEVVTISRGDITSPVIRVVVDAKHLVTEDSIGNNFRERRVRKKRG